QDRAEHNGVSAGGDCLAQVAGLLDAAISDDGNIAAGLAEEVVAGGGAFDRRANLGHANSQYLTTGADGSGTNANQDAGNARFHQLSRSAVTDRIANYYRDRQLTAKLFEAEAFETPRHVTSGRDSGLDEEDVAEIGR